MILNKIEIGNWVFEVPDDVYDILMNGLKNYVKGEKQFFVPSPTVEISLEDAKRIFNTYQNLFYAYNAKFSSIVIASDASDNLEALKQAISKAESKDLDTSEEIDNFKKFMRDFSPIYNKDLFDKISGGVKNKTLFEGLSDKLFDLYNRLNNNCYNQSTVLNQHTKEIQELKDTISQLQSVIEGIQQRIGVTMGAKR